MNAELLGGAGPFRIMGIVNVTPDSFSDGGLYLDPAAAVEHALELERQGAAILDLGGESTRPGAEPVPAAEEARRVIGVIEELIAAGATLVNDVTAFRSDPAIASLVAASGADCCLMHMLGEPRTMQQDPRYEDVVAEVKAFLEGRIEFAVSAGIAEERILLDPGIGFGKTAAHNLELLGRLDELVALGRPVVVGTSRKSFLGRLTGRATDELLAATIATNVLAYERGASVFRVHDVGPVRDALAVTAATVRAGCQSTTRTSSTTSTKV